MSWGVGESRFEGAMTKPMVDISPSITRDTSKCVLCRRCVTVCKQIQKVGAIEAQNRGFDTVVSPAMGLPLNSNGLRHVRPVHGCMSHRGIKGNRRPFTRMARPG